MVLQEHLLNQEIIIFDTNYEKIWGKLRTYWLDEIVNNVLNFIEK